MLSEQKVGSLFTIMKVVYIPIAEGSYCKFVCWVWGGRVKIGGMFYQESDILGSVLGVRRDRRQENQLGNY